MTIQGKYYRTAAPGAKDVVCKIQDVEEGGVRLACTRAAISARLGLIRSAAAYVIMCPHCLSMPVQTCARRKKRGVTAVTTGWQSERI